jgi:hypothetical protein
LDPGGAGSTTLKVLTNIIKIEMKIELYQRLADLVVL